MNENSFSYKLSPDQQTQLAGILAAGNYRPAEVPHTRIAVEGPGCRINLYTSGKCLVQGKGAKEWVLFVLEPEVLGSAEVGYEDVIDPSLATAHMGIDESGKGDFFGPLVIAAAYVNEPLADRFRELKVRDSKRITSDEQALGLARSIREVLGNRFALVTIGNPTYNKLYHSMRNVNRMLAWGHARAIENLLDIIPDCPRAVADQFGPARQVEQALMKKGRSIELEQRPKAESDPAVAAASILARAGFLYALRKMGETFERTIPKGASAQVVEAGVDLVRQRGPEVLLQVGKTHFKTTDRILEKAGHRREDLGPEGAATSKLMTPGNRGRRRKADA